MQKASLNFKNFYFHLIDRRHPAAAAEEGRSDSVRRIQRQRKLSRLHGDFLEKHNRRADVCLIELSGGPSRGPLDPAESGLD